MAIQIWSWWDGDVLYIKTVDADVVAVALLERTSTGKWYWYTAHSLGYAVDKTSAMMYAEKRLAFRTHEQWLEWCDSIGYDPTGWEGSNESL